jgi:hypothetical protein
VIPKEARTHAAVCMHLAKTASSPTVQKTLADLAKQWKRLANELDDAQALQKALDELDLKTASESDLSFPDESEHPGQQGLRPRRPKPFPGTPDPIAG